MIEKIKEKIQTLFTDHILNISIYIIIYVIINGLFFLWRPVLLTNVVFQIILAYVYTIICIFIENKPKKFVDNQMSIRYDYVLNFIVFPAFFVVFHVIFDLLIVFIMFFFPYALKNGIFQTLLLFETLVVCCCDMYFIVNSIRFLKKFGKRCITVAVITVMIIDIISKRIPLIYLVFVLITDSIENTIRPNNIVEVYAPEDSSWITDAPMPAHMPHEMKNMDNQPIYVVT